MDAFSKSSPRDVAEKSSIAHPLAWIGLFSGVGLLVSLILINYGVDLGAEFF
jgi:hypothetical protein